MVDLHVTLKVRAVHQALEVAAPAVLRVQAFPVRAKRGNGCFVPDDLPVLEEVEVGSATLQMNGVHGLTAARLEVDGLLFGCTR